MDNQNNLPIGRYILIAFIFILIFVGVAFLVYRLSNRTVDVNVSTQPSPTPVVTIPGGTVTNRVILPAPLLPPLNSGRTYTSPAPVVKTVPGKVVGSTGTHLTVAQDADGRLLINGLTHEERFRLEQQQLESQTRVRLAQEETDRDLTRQRLANDSRQATLNADVAKLQMQQAYLRDQQLLASRDRADARAAQIALEQERIKGQLEITKARTSQTQNESDQQVRVIEAQSRSRLALEDQRNKRELAEKQQANQAQLELARERNKAELAKSQQDRETQLALARERTQSQLVLVKSNNDNRTATTKLNNQYNLDRLTIQQKQQLASQAQQLAARERDNEFRLAATRLESNLRQAEREQTHRYNIDGMLLNYRINQDMARMQQYLNQYHYQPYMDYGDCDAYVQCI